MTMEKKQIIAIAAVVVVIVAAVGIALAMNNGGSSKKIENFEDLNGATVGVVKGYTGETFARQYIEDGKLSSNTDVKAYTSGAFAIDALNQGHVDCVIIDDQPAKTFVAKNSGLKILDTNFAVEDYAIAVKKDNKALLDKVNGALAEIKGDGTLEKIIKYYEDGVGEKYVREDTDHTGGKLNMITEAYFPPYEYFNDNGDGTIVGMDVDIMQAIASKLKMELVVKSMDFNALIGQIQVSDESENYVIAAGMTVTDERKANVDFTDPYKTSVQVIITKA